MSSNPKICALKEVNKEFDEEKENVIVLYRAVKEKEKWLLSSKDDLKRLKNETEQIQKKCLENTKRLSSGRRNAAIRDSAMSSLNRLDELRKELLQTQSKVTMYQQMYEEKVKECKQITEEDTAIYRNMPIAIEISKMQSEIITLKFSMKLREQRLACAHKAYSHKKAGIDSQVAYEIIKLAKLAVSQPEKVKHFQEQKKYIRWLEKEELELLEEEKRLLKEVDLMKKQRLNAQKNSLDFGQFRGTMHLPELPEFCSLESQRMDYNNEEPKSRGPYSNNSFKKNSEKDYNKNSAELFLRISKPLEDYLNPFKKLKKSVSFNKNVQTAEKDVEFIHKMSSNIQTNHVGMKDTEGMNNFEPKHPAMQRNYSKMINVIEDRTVSPTKKAEILNSITPQMMKPVKEIGPQKLNLQISEKQEQNTLPEDMGCKNPQSEKQSENSTEAHLAKLQDNSMEIVRDDNEVGNISQDFSECNASYVSTESLQQQRQDALGRMQNLEGSPKFRYVKNPLNKLNNDHSSKSRFFSNKENDNVANIQSAYQATGNVSTSQEIAPECPKEDVPMDDENMIEKADSQQDTHVTMAGSAMKCQQKVSPGLPNIICLSDDDDDCSNTLDITNVIGSAASMLLSPKQLEMPENVQTFSSGFKFWETGSSTLAQPSGANANEEGAEAPPATSKTTFSFNNPENKNKSSFFFNIFPKKF